MTAFHLPGIPTRLQGMALMVASMACFAVMNNCVRYTSLSLPTEQVVLLRNFGALMVLVFWMQRHRSFGHLRTRRLPSHLGRAMLGILSMHTWFYSLGHMPLAQATALSFTTPIFTTLLAMLIFKERGTARRWGAIALGFAGALVILRPSSGGINPIAAYALLSSVIIACVSIWVKSLSRTERTSAMLFYMALFMAIFSLPFGLLHWHAMTPALWLGASLLALTSLLAHSFLIEAYKHAEMTALMPFDFTRLLFTAGIAALWFGEQIDGVTLLGAAIIVAGSLLGARAATSQPSVNVASVPPPDHPTSGTRP